MNWIEHDEEETHRNTKPSYKAPGWIIVGVDGGVWCYTIDEYKRRVSPEEFYDTPPKAFDCSPDADQDDVFYLAGALLEELQDWSSARQGRHLKAAYVDDTHVDNLILLFARNGREDHELD